MAGVRVLSLYHLLLRFPAFTPVFSRWEKTICRPNHVVRETTLCAFLCTERGASSFWHVLPAAETAVFACSLPLTLLAPGARFVVLRQGFAGGEALESELPSALFRPAWTSLPCRPPAPGAPVPAPGCAPAQGRLTVRPGRGREPSSFLCPPVQAGRREFTELSGLWEKAGRDGADRGSWPFPRARDHGGDGGCYSVLQTLRIGGFSSVPRQSGSSGQHASQSTDEETKARREAMWEPPGRPRSGGPMGHPSGALSPRGKDTVDAT